MAGYLAKVFIHCIQHKREAKYIFPPLFHNLMPQNIQFTGRGEVLQELTENFRAGRYIQILSGMPGVGKTQVALHYAYENMHKYDIVWWVNVENEATLLEACSIFLHSKDVSAADSVAIRFCNYFERYNGFWLLIYDNVQYSTSEQMRLLNTYILKNNRTGHILMTSRWLILNSVGNPIVSPVHPLSHLRVALKIPAPATLAISEILFLRTSLTISLITWRSASG